MSRTLGELASTLSTDLASLDRRRLDPGQVEHTLESYGTSRVYALDDPLASFVSQPEAGSQLSRVDQRYLEVDKAY